MSIISFREVKRTFGRIEALRGVTLEVPAGCVYGLVGRNGAGKSTLLRMVPALLHPTAGEVRVFGRDPWQDEGVRRDLGYLSDSDEHPPLLRVRDLLELFAGLYDRWDDALVRRLLERFAIDPGRRLAALSKGQRRQVGLLCAVGHHPRLLVLDEPAGGLDPVARRGLLEVVLDVLASEGATVLFSSHPLSDVERIATRVGILHRGRLIADQPLDELKAGTCRVELSAEGIDRAGLAARLPAIRVASEDGRHRLTLLCGPQRVEEVIAAGLGAGTPFEVLDVQPVNLEEVFLDWTGDEP
jgi:ABC-2 type transport system ATP-binding protein